jgi:hypothetical protein
VALAGLVQTNQTGNVSVTGTLTATAFVGDGAGLTGLASVSQVIWSNLTVTAITSQPLAVSLAWPPSPGHNRRYRLRWIGTVDSISGGAARVFETTANSDTTSNYVSQITFFSSTASYAHTRNLLYGGAFGYSNDIDVAHSHVIINSFSNEWLRVTASALYPSASVVYRAMGESRYIGAPAHAVTNLTFDPNGNVTFSTNTVLYIDVEVLQ